MTRRSAAAFATTAALVLAFTGCAQPAPTTIVTTGRVLADNVGVQAPTLAVPRVSLDAGFQVAPGTPASSSNVSAALSLGAAQRIVAIPVRLGDQVEAGDVLVRFDNSALSAQLRVARADLAVARAQVGVLDAALDELADKQRDLRDKRRQVTDGIAKATKARKDLVGKLGEARKAAAKLPKQRAAVEQKLRELKPQLAAVEKQLAEVNAALAALPPDAPPEVREPLLEARQKLIAGRAQLRTAVGQLSIARGKLIAASAQVKKGIGQLSKGIGTIDSNVAKARDGVRKIDDGLAKLADARAGLKRTRKLAVIAARDTTAVDAASVARTQAIVRAPTDGIVTALAHVGDVVAPGATVARLTRPALIVTTWLAPEQAAQVCLGGGATVGLDSLAATVDGHVSRILPLAAYPPSYHTTDQVHLTRAVPVEVTVDSALPAGVPADVRLSTCSTTR